MPKRLELSGQKFGKLLVLKKSNSIRVNALCKSKSTWLCQCDCGNKKIIKTQQLLNGETRSCGCISNLDLIGHTYGKLKVVAFHSIINSKRKWKCKCECGNIVIVISSSLRSKNTTSCGCIRGLIPGRSAINRVIASYKLGAKNRNLNWCLTDEEVIQIINNDCFYCGKPPNNTISKINGIKKGLVYNGIDRLNNDKGYLVDNVVSCCFQYNRAKNNMKSVDFITWAKLIASRFKDEVKVANGIN